MMNSVKYNHGASERTHLNTKVCPNRCLQKTQPSAFRCQKPSKELKRHNSNSFHVLIKSNRVKETWDVEQYFFRQMLCNRGHLSHCRPGKRVRTARCWQLTTEATRSDGAKKRGRVGRTGPSPLLSQSSALTPAGDTKGTCACIWSSGVTCSLLSGLTYKWHQLWHCLQAQRRPGSHKDSHFLHKAKTFGLVHHICMKLNNCDCSRAKEEMAAESPVYPRQS